MFICFLCPVVNKIRVYEFCEIIALCFHLDSTQHQRFVLEMGVVSAFLYTIVCFLERKLELNPEWVH